MEDALPAFVLQSEADDSATMNELPPIPGEETDEQLMQAYAQGQAAAFSALFGRYRQPVFGFFRRRVMDAALAEELAQETFLAVVRAAKRYEAAALFRTWLYAIAFKILRAHRRKAASCRDDCTVRGSHRRWSLSPPRRPARWPRATPSSRPD